MTMNIDWNQLIELGAQYGIPALKALAILIVGWLIAKLTSKAVKKLLDKTELDNKLAQKLSGGRSEKIDIETGVSQFVYWLVLLFALMGAFQSLNLTIITEPLNALVTKITSVHSSDPGSDRPGGRGLVDRHGAAHGGHQPVEQFPDR